MAGDFAQVVKAQADIVKIVGEHVKLRKAGAQNWVGLCPFHGEKSPSFSVHAGRQFFHCFGCGVSGDVFTFLQKIENLTFPEAVTAVAQRMGIPLPKREFHSPEEAAEHRERAKLLELHELATVWFEEQMRGTGGAQARSYLAGRGLTDEGMKKFRMGFAPDSSNALRQHLERAYSGKPGDGKEWERLLRATGMFTAKEQEDGTRGPLYPYFRGRVMFPIANEAGRVIAFTGRVLAADAKTAKYLNSPETSLYSKGQVLFNLHNARPAIRQLEFALLVEGQMDCISVALAGVGNVIATSGTAFTEAQVRLLARYTPSKRVIVNFDGDAAGQNAAEKSIALLAEEGFEVRVVLLEDGLDPDRFVRERGLAEYTKKLKGAQRQTEYLLDRARALHPPTTPQGKVDALNYLLPHIRRMPNAIAREDFALEAAHRLGIDGALVREELKQAASGKRRPLMEMPTLKLSDAEREILRALAGAHDTPAFAAVASALAAEPADFAGLSCSALLQPLLERAAEIAPLDCLPADGGLRPMLAGVLLAEGQGDLELHAVQAALLSLRCAALEREQRTVRVALAEAERSGNEARVVELMTRKQDVERALRAL